MLSAVPSTVQVYDLEKRGGSIVAGVLALMRDKKANPPPARDERLPPKPAGQTVGSFRRGLTMLPEAIAANLSEHIRCFVGAHGLLGCFAKPVVLPQPVACQKNRCRFQEPGNGLGRPLTRKREQCEQIWLLQDGVAAAGD